MNISTDPWIPVLWDDGKAGLVSLCDIFARGDRIRDLAVRPHERIALMRLLVCIAQAALDGPEHTAAWEKCRERLGPDSLSYLEKKHKTFELFGRGQRFLQVDGVSAKTCKGKEPAATQASKLDIALASGHNSTLFDNGGGIGRSFEPARLALNALAFQCFSPGGRIGVARWNTAETPGKGASEHAPCMANGMLHALIRRDHLLETVRFNLLCRDQVSRIYGRDRWGKPVWEWMPRGMKDRDAVENATSTYLGRLVPLSRCLRLADDGRSLILANGLGYGEWREASATIVTRGSGTKQERVFLRVSLSKAVWRELHAVTVLARDAQGNGGPLVLGNVKKSSDFDVWVGGVASKQAKILDTVESVLHVPSAMLDDVCQKTYGEGVRWAESISSRLGRAICTYRRELGDNLDRAESRNRRMTIQGMAADRYWTEVEQSVPKLLEIASSPSVLGQPSNWAKTAWGSACRQAVLRAYEAACPSATSRQLKAYVKGLESLNVDKADSGDAEDEVEENEA